MKATFVELPPFQRLRVVYYGWLGGEQFWLFTVYDKDQADDLTADQRKSLKRLLETERQMRQLKEV